MTLDIATRNDSASTEPTISDLNERDIRALTEYMSVLEDIGQVRGADGMYLVVTQREYTVDLVEGTCQQKNGDICPDQKYNLGLNEECKHVKRARYATGQLSIPAEVDESAIDPQLGDHVTHVADEE
ncbi:hypothetical protein [Natrinema soli]|uniref:SWIM-type domain-containing protein n=1 Tax=Natrinema soli TaxID=1930624 RepID=A0ABD5SMC0_9EURY|nr:hypothetical protein [Natrinema soli]